MTTPRKSISAAHKTWMKSNGYTEKQMNEFWDENIKTNLIVGNLASHGMTWRDLNLSCVQKLPTQKARDLESANKKRIEDELRAKRELEEKQARDYYSEHFEELMVEKIDKGEELTEWELSRIRDFSICDDKGDEGRWVRHITSILEMCGRYFKLYWDRGLTECQENDFSKQPYEVEKSVYEKTITVVEWIRKRVK